MPWFFADFFIHELMACHYSIHVWYNTLTEVVLVNMYRLSIILCGFCVILCMGFESQGVWGIGYGIADRVFPHTSVTEK